MESLTMVPIPGSTAELQEPVGDTGSFEREESLSGVQEIAESESLYTDPLLSSSFDTDTDDHLIDDSASEAHHTKRSLSEYVGKGEVSNLVAFVVMVVGIVLTVALDEPHDTKRWYLYRCIRALGLFGFSGGVTNWLAVKMLFDRIPLLIGSGVITRRFQEIRETIKQVILDTIFEPEAMQDYIDQRTGSFLSGFNLEEHIQAIMQSDVVDAVIDRKIAELMARPEGLMFAMMGIDAAKLKSLVKPFVFGLGVELAPMLVKVLDSMDLINGYRIREQVEQMMSNRLQEFTPPKVKELVEKMIRKHLGWLVVWGNALGAVFGLITELISIYA
ncbi:uncharacterized protein LOC135829018 isoform X2 [Sycon ciliatum]|uniref:uncharacterized protein LOC135829018 isoform X2 n=1 Tax=Sycon ciliatum TaxID=27933 RepID=UPI0031F602DA